MYSTEVILVHMTLLPLMTIQQGDEEGDESFGSYWQNRGTFGALTKVNIRSLILDKWSKKKSQQYLQGGGFFQKAKIFFLIQATTTNERFQNWWSSQLEHFYIIFICIH